MVTSTTNFKGLLTPTYGGKAMPYTGKQERFFQAVAHGMKPTKTSSTLTPDKAKELLGHEKKKVEARKKGMTRALEKM